MSNASEESINHGAREDNEEYRHRVEHLVATCCHMVKSAKVKSKSPQMASISFLN